MEAYFKTCVVFLRLAKHGEFLTSPISVKVVVDIEKTCILYLFGQVVFTLL